MMDSSYALSPLDGRYSKTVTDLQPIFSEFGLVQRRVQVEVEYLLALHTPLKLPSLTAIQKRQLRTLHLEFSEQSFQAIKQHESITKHDVKAVEYFLRDHLDLLHLAHLKPWLHFALTSEDVNNIAQTLQLRDGSREMLRHMQLVSQELLKLISQTKTMPMLARTHGQPAVPTTLGKELLVHLDLLQQLAHQIQAYPYHAKLTGAVGTLAAHHVAYPEIDWIAFSDKFVRSFGFQTVQVTTQILPGLYWTQLWALLQQYCLEIAALTQDLWWYNSFGYVQQKVVATETGSSTMPQKLNPIDFENAEGNAQQAAALFAFFITKFAASRLQRDLSDSTIRRNFGVAYGHLLVAIKSLQAGLSKLAPDPEMMLQDIHKHPEVVAEAYQTILRASGVTNGYEIIKEASRGGKFEQQEILAKIRTLNISKQTIKTIESLQPELYTGVASVIVDKFLIEQKRQKK